MLHDETRKLLIEAWNYHQLFQKDF